MSALLTRRDLLVGSAALATTGALPTQGIAAEGAPAERTSTEGARFHFCLNASTINGWKLTVPRQIEIAAKAGYEALEPWLPHLHEYVAGGGKLKDLRQQLIDSGLTVPSAIGFGEWIVDDAQRRRKGLAQCQRDMDVLAQIGAKRIAAPPSGATDQADLNLLAAAERYRALLVLGEKTGVVPQLECWGHSRSLSRLGEIAFVAIESGHSSACLLPDVYHIYRGGSDFTGLRFVDGKSIHVFHLNDYPATPPRADLKDADRVYPGDGAAPLNQILVNLRSNGFRGYLSLELFNRDYWKQDPNDVAATGLRKMRAMVAGLDAGFND
ncbi:MAG TPA: TIM barrel protein [Pirellulales bacterium]|nr:TIM barrel protein [Pirellulales bacterium]